MQAVAISSVGAGIIHVLVVREHLQEYWLFGAFFAALAAAQIVWSLLVLGDPSRRVLTFGIVMNLGTVAVWAVSRSAGMPIGPAPWVPERVGLLDVMATLLELGVAGGTAWLLRLESAVRPEVAERVAVSKEAGLGRFLKPHRATLGLAATLTVIGTLLDLAAPWPLKVVLDNAIMRMPLPRWLNGFSGMSAVGLAATALGASIALIGLGGLFDYVITYLTGATAERVGGAVRVAAFGRLQHVSLRFHDSNRTGDLANRLTADVSRVQDAMVAWLATIFPETVRLLGIVAILFLIDFQMALAVVLIIPLLAVFTAYIRPRMKRAQRAARDRTGSLASGATEILRNIRAVQAFGRQEEESERFRAKSDEVVRSSVAAVEVSARYSPVANFILGLGSAAVLLLGVMKMAAAGPLSKHGGVMRMNANAHITMGTLVVVLTYLAATRGPIRSLTRQASVLAKGAASRDRILEVFHPEHVVREPSTAVEVAPGPLSVGFRRVTFAYAAGAPVLRDVSFHVRAGERVCIVGPTGAGKSTLLSLMMRLYDVDEGRVELGEVDVRRYASRSLRSRLALVPQDPWILDGTIADNIAFGLSGASPENVRRAGRISLVDEFAKRLPDQYDTVVGEGGVLLSGGQRRRIALARALIRDATVVLLDEPTSGLDAASEALIIQALRRIPRDRTLIVVSHRLQVASLADRVVVLARGRVVEEGSPSELVRKRGAFASLWALHSQSGGREKRNDDWPGKEVTDSGNQGTDERVLSDPLRS